jgi:TPR repeat protein
MKPATRSNPCVMRLTAGPGLCNPDVSCGACGAALTHPLRCAGCQSVSYCNSSCQRAHWKAAHKKACKAAAATLVDGFRKEASTGNPVSQFNLGVLCLIGNQMLGIVKDEKEAVRWFRAAADSGVVKAVCALGRCYSEGTGVAKDETEAARLFRCAAEIGDPEAQFYLGRCYANGRGLAQNGAEAVRWFCAAAEGGNADAQFVLSTADRRAKIL